MYDSRTVALTGGIGSGKSTVSRMFQDCGAHVVDADMVARQVVEPDQPAWREIVAHFGTDIVLEDGHLNRTKLGQLIFNNPDERRRLNHIVHPRVRDVMQHRQQTIRRLHPQALILHDIPLLIEVGQQSMYATVLVVYVSETVQLERLIARDRISEDAARKRLNAQMPMTEKLAYATHVIHNNECFEMTRKQVETLYRQLLENSPTH